ncbi:MAG: DUF4381 domain-containing protein [Gammaproteobacteria bacterium]
MSANADPLAALRDIHAAPAPPFWPLAPGWWLLGVLLGSTLALLGYRLFRHYRRWRRRRSILQALTELYRALQNGGTQAEFAAQLSMLLRRAALARFARSSVAGLNDSEWLQFLDRTGGNGGFAEGPGRALASAPYARAAEFDASRVYALARAWLQRNC